MEWLEAIPVHWSLSKLRYAFSFGKGLSITKENLVDEGIPCVNYGELHSKFGFEVDPSRYQLRCVDHSYLKNSPSALLRKGDFVFADTSEDIEGSGNFTQLISDISTFAGYHTIIVRPECIDNARFFAYLFDSIEFRTRIRHAVKGVKVFSITQAILRDADVWLPSGAEQEKIAAFLDHETAKIDALIEKQQRLIELLKEKRQAVISHAVTKGLNPNAPMKDSGVEWLGEVPAHWNVTKLGWICQFITYGFTNPMPTTDEGPYMLTAADIEFGRVKYEDARTTSKDAFLNLLSEKSKPHKGDLLLTKDGTLGRVAVFDGEQATCISQSIALLRFFQDRASPDFVSIALMGADYQAKMLFDAGGTTIKHIYISVLSKMQIVLPEIKEQNEIVYALKSRLLKVDQLIDRAQCLSTFLQERRSALISAAVTGKIDVRDWQAA